MARCSSFSFKPVCTWKPEKKVKGLKYPSGFVVHCSNPEFETERFKSYIDAFHQFQEWLSDFVRTLIPSGCPEIEISNPTFSGKSQSCAGSSELDTFLMHCEVDEISISWTVWIKHQPNRTLDEFETAAEKFDDMVQDLKDEGITMSIGSVGETA